MSVVLALLVTGIFPAASLYALQSGQTPYTERDAIYTAKWYLKKSPTFQFDGIQESINVTDVYRDEANKSIWIVRINFDCAHSGYGDRTGEFLLQVITNHEAKIVVMEESVVSAVIDEKWDMMEQKMIGQEYTKDGAVNEALEYLKNSPTYVFDGIPETVKVEDVVTLRMPYTWEITLTFQSRHAGYGNRKGMMLAQVITPHEMKVVISEGEIVRAVLDGKWNCIEQRETVQSELLPPEEAIDLAIEYVIENHGQLSGLDVPESWEYEDVTPPSIVGSQTDKYTSDGWIVTSQHPVVQHPVYTIHIEYNGEISFIWEGTVGQNSFVEETFFETN